MKWDAKRRVRRKPPRRSPPFFVLFLIVFVGTIAVTQSYMSGWFNGLSSAPMALVSSANADTATGERVSFSFCHSGGGENCVVDGDTIWLHGEKIRIADYDTPETHEPKCQSEKELGDRATQRLHELLQSGAITLEPIDRDEDQYGRKLRIVKVNGESVGETLVNEGLARWYEGGRRPWC